MNVELITNSIPALGQARLSRRAIGVLMFVWIGVLAAGFALLADRDTRPASQGVATDDWPRDSQWQFNRERPTLLMFVHPRCPCSRSSLAELERVVAENPSADVRLVMVKPDGAPADWDQTATAQAAKELPAVTIVRDEGGAEAKRFGAMTSGQTCLYDTAGHLLFRGGITAGRGHFGENESSDKLIDLLTGRSASARQTPVYGCPLQNEDSKSQTTP